MKNLLISIFWMWFSLTSCTTSVKPENLYGKWMYVKVENPKQNPPDSLTTEELAEQNPSISFSKSGKLLIMWDGKQLSAGKYRLEGNIIRYTESLPNGSSRKFPFLITKLSAEELFFETMEQDVTRVRAKKINRLNQIKQD